LLRFPSFPLKLREHRQRLFLTQRSARWYLHWWQQRDVLVRYRVIIDQPPPLACPARLLT
jgi:hypothetical protein